MINHIEEYLLNNSDNNGNLISRELFEVGENDSQLDFKTDLTSDEIKNITSLFYNDVYLESIGLPKIFSIYYQKYMRLLISKDRKSRGEFVSVNKTDNSDETIDKIGSLASIGSTKK